MTQIQVVAECLKPECSMCLRSRCPHTTAGRPHIQNAHCAPLACNANEAGQKVTLKYMFHLHPHACLFCRPRMNVDHMEAERCSSQTTHKEALCPENTFLSWKCAAGNLASFKQSTRPTSQQRQRHVSLLHL